MLTAVAVFFLIVKPVNVLISRSHSAPTPDPQTHKWPECLSEIPVQARRCAFCTTAVAADAAG